MNVNAKLVLKNILMKNISKNLIFQESTKALLLNYCLKHKMLSSNRKLMSRDVSPPPKKFFSRICNKLFENKSYWIRYKKISQLLLTDYVREATLFVCGSIFVGVVYDYVGCGCVCVCMWVVGVYGLGGDTV